eukprot:jgi/Galph1/1249/GphlegSOOS_G6076.1
METQEEPIITFRQEVVSSLLQQRFRYHTRMREDGLTATVEYLRYITQEAIDRAAKETKKEERKTIELADLEKIVPQWLLDH